MRFNHIYDSDLQNGQGVGVTLGLQGCTQHCEGCFNQEAWPLDGGYEWTPKIGEQLCQLLQKDYIDHLAIIGGEPLLACNIVDLSHLVMYIKQRMPEKKIWMWTGYLWESIIKTAFRDAPKFQENKALRNILFNIDILVDGPFIQEQKDITLKWRGSTNQRVIDCAATLAQDNWMKEFIDTGTIEPILYCN